MPNSSSPILATQTQALAGNHVSANALQVLKDSMGYDPVPIFRIAKKRLVETGKPADPVLKKLANVDPSFEQAAKLVYMHDVMAGIWKSYFQIIHFTTVCCGRVQDARMRAGRDHVQPRVGGA